MLLNPNWLFLCRKEESLSEANVEDVAKYAKQMRAQLKAAIIAPETVDQDNPVIQSLMSEVQKRCIMKNTTQKAVLREILKELDEPMSD